MSCCCTKTYRVCDVITCDTDDLVLPIEVPADGEYALELEFLGDMIRKSAMLSAGDNFSFPNDNLNERFTYVGYIKAPDGSTVTFEKGGKTYDCIEFTTKREI